jgi:hypothetical protein
MKLLIHGDDLEKSREYLNQERESLRNPILLDAENLTFDTFFQAAENKSLFDEQIFLVIENLLSKNKANSLELKNIIEFINNSKNLNVILWEQSEISKTSQSLLKNFDVKVFLIPRLMFAFLDQIRPGNSQTLIKIFHELLATEAPELIFFMLIRQFRLFLQVSEKSTIQIDEVKRMAPWQLSKLSKQASYFTKENLVSHYNRIFEMEINQKTGKSFQDLTTSIDFFLSHL